MEFSCLPLPMQPTELNQMVFLGIRIPEEYKEGGGGL